MHSYSHGHLVVTLKILKQTDNTRKTEAVKLPKRKSCELLNSHAVIFGRFFVIGENLSEGVS